MTQQDEAEALAAFEAWREKTIYDSINDALDLARRAFLAAWNRRADPPPALPADAFTTLVTQLGQRIGHRLNAYLVEMKPDYDDSIIGFNEAWNIVRDVFADFASERAERAAEVADMCMTNNHDVEALLLASAELAQARAALTACADQFQSYAELHAAAGKHEKAATNQSFADLARSALATGGKP